MMKLNNLDAAYYLLIHAYIKDPSNHRPFCNLASIFMREVYAQNVGEEPVSFIQTQNRPGFYSTPMELKDGIVDFSRLFDAKICLEKVLDLKPDHPEATEVLKSIELLVGPKSSKPPTEIEVFKALHINEVKRPKASVLPDNMPKNIRKMYANGMKCVSEYNFTDAKRLLKQV